MKRQERDELLRKANEQQINLLSVMAKSDAHASKCSKLGFVFSDEYPQEYAEYCSAREKYNANEERIAELESACIEEEEHVPFEEERMKFEEKEG